MEQMVMEQKVIEQKMTVLVGYASAGGSTRQIADRIAAGLRRHGLRPQVRSMEQIQRVTSADAVVLGSAIHDMAWLPAATQVLRRNAKALQERPVWLFSVGALNPGGSVRAWVVRQEAARVARAFPPAIRPREHRVFAGVVRNQGWPGWARLLLRALGGRMGDQRDWAGIDAWADRIAEDLVMATGRAATAPGPP